MKKINLIILLSVFLLINTLLVTAKLSCEIVDSSTYAPDDCNTNGELIFKLSDISPEGGHLGDATTSNLKYNLCCYGIPGLSATTTPTEDYIISLSNPTDDAHVSIINGTAFTDYYLTAPTAVSCGYSTYDCDGFDTCLLSVQDDTPEDAHVSDCGGYSKELCCTAGEAICTVNAVYWGIIEGEGINLLEDATIGMRQLALMIIQGDNCEDYVADFKLLKSGAAFNTTVDVLFGTIPEFFGGGELPGYALATWWSTDGLPTGNWEEDFTFSVTLKNPGYGTVQSPSSGILTVNSQCIALNPYNYTDECDFTEESLDAAGCNYSKTDCDGNHGCVDADCDLVDDCLDEYIFTSSESDICTGTAIGTSGCIPNMDCTNLEWSTCYECKAGEDCDTIGGFRNEFVMERCQGLDPDKCICKWIGDKPEGCSDALVNQWDNRFKGCIMEEEFPIFDNWNFFIVVFMLLGYYGIIIYRKKK